MKKYVVEIFDWKSLRREETEALIALLYTAVLLTVLEYFFFPPTVERWLRGLSPSMWAPPSLEAGAIWALACVAGYFLVPYAFSILIRRERVEDIGLSWKGLKSHLPVYLILFLMMTPILYFVSNRADFQQSYPFVREATRSMSAFFIWESLYILQFFALEAFFRGYLLFRLEKVLHRGLAVAVMVVPYTMIHFHKPVLETLGAVVAGFALGLLALRYRSWLGGALIHASVGFTMDFLSALKAGLF